MNDIVKATVNVPATSAQQMRAAIMAKVKARVSEGTAPQTRDTGSKMYARFSGNDGSLTIGAAKTEIPAGQKFLVALHSAMHGMIEWAGNKPSGQERLCAFVDGGAPDAPEGARHKGSDPKRPLDGWAPTVVLEFTGYEGELAGITVSFALHSNSACDAGRELVKAMFDKANEGSEKFNAVIEISVGSYVNKTYGKTIYFPEFNIVGWTDGFEIDLLHADGNDPLA